MRIYVKGKVSSLVIAKNRVAPLKEITLPKLELMAAVVGARIGNQLRHESWNTTHSVLE